MPDDTLTRYQFFVGKGGVGKSVVACSTAIGLADAQKRVLLVSTDPASNLAEMLDTTIGRRPTRVAGAFGLFAMNLEPSAASADYRQRILEPLGSEWPADRVAALEAELDGACTVEIAMVDAFAKLLTDTVITTGYDHVLFDTAPTGHTLRLLELPGRWTSFLTGFEGEWPLRPYLGLRGEVARLERVVATFRDPAATTFVLVTRPERPAVAEAERALGELRGLGVSRFQLAINGVFRAEGTGDAVSRAMERSGKDVLDHLPAALSSLPTVRIPLRGEALVGVATFRRLFEATPADVPESGPVMPEVDLPALEVLIDAIAEHPASLTVVVGKGGVGKTTVAAAIALALAQHGLDVELTTTDPAGQLGSVLGAHPVNLQVSKPDPEQERRAYVEGVLESVGQAEGERSEVEREMASPCAEEVAMFRAFARMVSRARTKAVVIDTAATGHMLLLMDKTGAYHRETARELAKQGIQHVVTPLMRLQDPSYARIIIVTLPERTPVSEAATLQDELRGAGVEPWAWVINQSLAKAGTKDPVLRQRVQREQEQMARVRRLAERVALVPWLPAEPHGEDGLQKVISGRFGL